MSEVAQPAHQTPRLLFNKRLGCLLPGVVVELRAGAPPGGWDTRPYVHRGNRQVAWARTPPPGWARSARRSTGHRNQAHRNKVCLQRNWYFHTRRDPLWFVAKFLQRVSGKLTEFRALGRAHCSLPTGDSFKLWGFRGESLLKQSLLAGKQRAAIEPAA